MKFMSDTRAPTLIRFYSINSNIQEEVMLENYANTFASEELVNVTYIFFGQNIRQ